MGCVSKVHSVLGDWKGYGMVNDNIKMTIQ